MQFKLAELKTEVEALRALTYRACDLYVNGQDVLSFGQHGQAQGRPPEPRGARHLPAVRGGMGFTLENKVSRMYRDGRLASIGGGADEVMLGILASSWALPSDEQHPQ